MNYKKSLLSLAAIIALGNIAAADATATYTPLASETSDSIYSLFGVNGFSDGTPSAIGTVTGAFGPGLTALADTVIADELATSGLPAAAGGGDLATLQAIDDAGTTSLQVGVNLTGTIFEPTESVRIMYVKVNSSTPNLKLNYKASLEGKGMEILRNSVLYSVTINQNSTFAGAITATLGGLTAAASNVTDRVNITDVLDANFTNNPTDAIYFDSTVHFDATITANLFRANMYHFNSITQQWEVWNINNPANANDFTKYSIGKAYWGRTDTKDITSDNDGSSGLVLGQATALSGIPNPDRYQDDANASTLTVGWNMLSFDDHKPFIRHAATGLVLTGLAATDTLTITDDSGLNSIDINASLMTLSSNDQNLSTYINTEVESAKLRGILPFSFNIKSFYGGVAGTHILISDKKFTVSDQFVNGTIAVKTLTGANPFVAGVRTAVADLNTTGAASSAYGEYAIMVDLLTSDLVGATTAASLDSVIGSGGTNVSAKILFGDKNGDNTAIVLANNTAGDINPTATTSAAAIVADPIFNGTDGTGRSIVVDSDNNGTTDKVIISSTIPFYIKDNTFVRVFAFDTTGTDGTKTITVSNSNSASIAPAAAATTATAVAALIQAQADTAALTNVYASVGATATNLIAIATNSDLFDVKDVENGADDFLSEGSDNSPIAKGAIGNIYSLDNVAALPLIQHELIGAFTGLAQPDDENDSVNITITDINGSAIADNNITAGTAAIVNSATGRKAWFDLLVSKINALIATIPGNMHAFATHDYSTTTDSLATSKIFVAGVDIAAFSIDLNNSITTVGSNVFAPVTVTDANSATAGTLGSGLNTGDLASDLKTNPIYTPNFAIQGPLYTLRNSGTGYDARAFLKATTETDATGGAITFDSIDITRSEADWFKNNEFNLFKTNHYAGYWVYLEDKTPTTVAIGAASFGTPGYTYYFSNKTGFATTNLINSGQFSVTITGLNDAVAGSAYAIIAGEDVQLKRTSAGSNTFTADVTKYALKDFSENTAPISIDVRAVNGKGEEVNASTVVSFDYAKPTFVTAVTGGATTINLGSSSTDTANFYVFKDFIPEVAATRTAAITSTVPVVANPTSFEVCSKFTFGDTTSLRIVGADGVIEASNLSDAVGITYATTLKGAHVLTHTQGVNLKTQIGATYDTSCALNATQPSLTTDNNGVSLATLTTGEISRLAFLPDTLSNFTIDIAWTAHYKIGAGVAIVQIQSTSAYAGDAFFLEYQGKLYTSTFVSSSAAGDASISAPLALTLVSAVNPSLVP